MAHLSLIETPPETLIGIAAASGFDLVDLRLSPATPADTRYTDSERRALCRRLIPLLRDIGLRVWDVEIIRIHEQTDPQDHLPLLEAAALLGASRVKLVCDCDDHARAAGLLGQLCEHAASFGLTLDLEFMVFSGVKSLAAAVGLVAAVDRPDLLVLVDALHWMRARDDLASLRAAAARLGYVQLCDGPLIAPVGRKALIQEARTSRLVPGEGEFPLEELLHAMPPDCVASLEVPLPAGCDPLFHARRLQDAARTLVERHEQETR